MRTAVDSNILSALFGVEPTSSRLVELLGQCRQDGPILICGTVFAEIHAIPKMTAAVLGDFLADTGVDVDSNTTLGDWSATGIAFAQYAALRRSHKDGQPKRLLADFAIGAHAFRSCDRLLTLDPSRYRTAFPELSLLGP